MKKRISIISIAIFLVLMMGTQVFATSKRETLTLGKNQVWNTTSAISRSGYYNDITARLYAVYPTNGGGDNFTKIQFKAENSSGVNILSASYYVLYESATSESSYLIKNGYLNTQNVKFSFRGNNASYAATCDVSYNSR
jgi:hypothetical protein